MSKYGMLICLSGLLASAALPLQAQTLPTNSNNTVKQKNIGDTPLDEITVTATKDGEPAIDALAGSSVVNNTELQRQQLQRIGGAITGIPGVAIQVNPDDPATAINIRGLQDFGRVSVTVDGARQNFQRSGHNADGAFFLDPAFVRVIDVTRGPVANVYGSGAIGGVVSFRTVEPSDVLRPGERVAVEFRGNGLTFRHSGGNGNVVGAFRAGTVVSGLLGFSYSKMRDFKDGDGVVVTDSAQELKSGIGKLVITPAEGHKIVLGGMLQQYNFTNGIGTQRTPRRTNDVRTRNFFLQYNFTRPDLPWLNLKASIYDTSTDTLQVQVSGTPAEIGNASFFKINTRGFDLNNTSKLHIGETSVFLTYGVDGFRDKVRTFDPFSNGDEFTPGGQRDVYGAFMQAHLKWSMFDVIAAARYDAYKLTSLNGAIGSSGSRISPKITFGYTSINGVRFYASYAEGYRAPAITETLVSEQHPPPAAFTFIPNPTLRPEVGKTIEAGVNLKFNDLFRKDDKFRAKLSVFQNDVTDYIEGVFSDPGAPCGAPIPGACNDATFKYNNITKALIRGVELEGSYDARRWFIKFSGSIIRGDNKTANAPLESIYPAKFVVDGGLRFLNEKLIVGGRVSFFAAQKRLPVTSQVLASRQYTLVDLYASYEFMKDAKAFLRINNVGDVRYRQFRFNKNSQGLVLKMGLFTRFGI